ncbi:MAG TPA: phosphotransferase [Gaiellales bacterium]|nr:phosphotransferase [Gaiellales bacterium]
MEQSLPGGNTHSQIVRVGNTVRRPTGPWTSGVHALLCHLEHEGFGAAPRVHGIDEQGREILDYVEGDVVHPQHPHLLDDDCALEGVAATIRDYHDAVASFDGAQRFAWSDRGADPTGSTEILCHNDLAAWNLVRSKQGGWVLIDWDLAAPGRRSWDLAWALLSVLPLMPGAQVDDARICERLRRFALAYGEAEFPKDVLVVAQQRCEREAELIERLGGACHPPYDRLRAEGHGEVWSSAAAHVAARRPTWESFLGQAR